MLGRVREFIARHRKKFLVTGIMIGGTYFIIRYAQRKLKDFQERQAREFLEKTRRMQHFEWTEKTCNQVIIGMSTELCAAIIRECNTNDLLAQLRQNPANKVELWEEIKIIAFTRLTSFIYASSMLVIALRVQMNLLGGYLYRDYAREEKECTDELKEQYLSFIRHFIHDGGLAVLVQLIYTKVVSVMKSLPLNRRFSFAEMEQLFWSLQMSINTDAEDPITKMYKYLMPSQTPEYSAPLLQRMYNETLDMLESDDASSVCSNNVCRGFSLAVDAIAENLGDTIMIAQRSNEPPTSSDGVDNPITANGTVSTTEDTTTSTPRVITSNSNNNNNSPMVNINNVEVPLAKIIPIVSGITSKGYDNESRPQNLATSLVTFYIVSEKAKTLGANVYETFSSSS